MLRHPWRAAASQPYPASIATAPDGVPIQILARVARVTIVPGAGRMLVTLADGSGEAAVTFRREDAPDLPTGAWVLADGVFTPDPGSPRAFEAVAVWLAEDRRSTPA
jgi:hypothetical protein